jgi:hypothetical protein
MTKNSEYTTPSALRQALEHRLQRRVHENHEDLDRLRRHVAFDRLLARIFLNDGGPWILKGGYSLELRLALARMTRDIDLSLSSPTGLPEGDRLSARLQAGLQTLASIDVGDFFDFQVGPATMDIDAAPYGGARLPIDARMAGRTFVRFHIDIGVGDSMVGPGQVVSGHDWLGFANILAPRVLCISIEQQFAEKLHAYTLTGRPKPNSRVKDLVDMALLVQRLPLDLELLVRALRETFGRRDSHPLPTDLAEPPAFWVAPFTELAQETALGLSMAEAFEVVRSFYLALPQSK